MSKSGLVTLCTGLALVVVAAMTAAQAPTPPGTVREKEKVRIKVDPNAVQKGKVVEKGVVEKGVVRDKVVAHETHFVPHRSSEMIGMHITTPKGGELGVVKDMVIDCMSGQVRYVVVSFTGFADASEKLYAVPWQVFECRAEGKEHVLMAEITETQILKAPSFTVSEWPSFTETRWFETNDAWYRENFKFRSTRTADRDVDVQRDVRRDGAPEGTIREKEIRKEKSVPPDDDDPKAGSNPDATDDTDVKVKEKVKVKPDGTVKEKEKVKVDEDK